MRKKYCCFYMMGYSHDLKKKLSLGSVDMLLDTAVKPQ